MIILYDFKTTIALIYNLCPLDVASRDLEMPAGRVSIRPSDISR